MSATPVTGLVMEKICTTVSRAMGLLLFAIGEAEGAEVGFLAAFIHQRRHTDDLLAVDEALERAVDGGRVDERSARERREVPAQAAGFGASAATAEPQ